MKTDSESLLKGFTTYILVERRLSKKTHEVYFAVAKQFLQHISDNNLDVATIDVREIEEWVMGLSLNPRTVSKYFSSLTSFFKFLVSRNIREDNPTELFSKVKKFKPLPQVHTVEEIEALLDIIGEADAYAIRDRAMFELIYSSALRVSEVVNLRVDDYFPDEGVLRVINTKRGKSRIVPVGERALEAVSEYLKSARQSFVRENDNPSLFLSQRGEGIKRCEIWKRLDKYSDELGIHFTVHSLRHSFGTHMLERGANLRVIQALLGHSDLRSTEVYTHLDNSKLKTEYFKHK